ncbi:MAG: cation:proton antiporter, partial [Christensenellales bacterium]
GVYGVFKLKYAANRMHAAALNDTLGVSFCLIGLAISAPDFFTALKILLVVVFLWLASPVASHLLCRLEVETNEDRGQYMNVHEKSLAQERREETAHAEEEQA